MSQNHTWRKITHVSPADMTQLCAFWILRTTLPRPVRRRAVEAGILHPGAPPMFTHEGTVWMHEHAPRSKWPRPTHEVHAGKITHQAVVAAMALSSLTSGLDR